MKFKMTVSQLLNDIIKFGKRKDNPHKLDTNIMKTYPKKYIDGQFNDTVSSNIIPISYMFPYAAINNSAIERFDGGFRWKPFNRKGKGFDILFNGRVHHLDSEDDYHPVVLDPTVTDILTLRSPMLWVKLVDNKVIFYIVGKSDAPTMITNYEFPVSYLTIYDDIISIREIFMGMVIDGIVIGGGTWGDGGGSIVPSISKTDSENAWLEEIIE